jgi:hypothetical protein
MEGFMKYAVTMGLGAMIYISSFMMIGLIIQKLIGRCTDTQISRRKDSMEIA